MSQQQVESALGEYGYTLSGLEIVSPKGRHTGAFISFKRGRCIVSSAPPKSHKIWSGAPGNIGDFLESFWYVVKLRS